MIVQEIVSALGVEVAAGVGGLTREVTGGYASDLLSCVMAGAQPGNVWVTLQAHPNVIAVADLRELACVVIAEGGSPDAETLARADEKQVPVLLAAASTFSIVAQLVEAGVTAAS